MSDATGRTTELLAVVYRADGLDGLRRTNVELIDGYTTRDDVEKIIAVSLGVKPDDIIVYSMAPLPI